MNVFWLGPSHLYDGDLTNCLNINTCLKTGACFYIFVIIFVTLKTKSNILFTHWVEYFIVKKISTINNYTCVRDLSWVYDNKE